MEPFGVNRVLAKIKSWTTSAIATHTAIVDAHHTKYTDAEVDAILAVHTAIVNAHHTKYTNAEAVTAMGVKADNNPLHHDKTILDAVHVQRFAAGSLSIPTGVTTLLDFDNDAPPFEDAVVEYDYGGLYSNAQSSRITIQKAGLYVVAFIVHWAFNNVGSYRGIYIFKNGGYVTGNSPEPHQSAAWYQQVSQPLKLAVNDYIEIKCYQDSGSNINIDYGYYYLGLWCTMLREV